MITVFFLILGAHVCGDMFVYSPRIAKRKRSGSFLERSKFISGHAFIHAFFIWIWLWSYGLYLKISASIYILIVHFLIDIARTYYEQKVIDEEKFHIFQRKDIVKLALRKTVSQDTQCFLNQYRFSWLRINVLDQTFHFLSIFLFVLIWSRF